LKLHVKRTGRSRTFGRQKVNSAIIRLRNLLWVDELAVLDCILSDIKPRASKLVLTVAKEVEIPRDRSMADDKNGHIVLLRESAGFHTAPRAEMLHKGLENMKLRTALFISSVALSVVVLAASQAAPQWHTLATEAYPKKRDDIVFADSNTGYYGTGKGKLYRTQDGGNSWQLIWSKPGTFIRSLGFIDVRHGFLGNLGPGLGGTTDPTPLYETKDGGLTWEPAKIGSAAVPGVCSIDILKSRSIHEGDISERYYIHAAGRANGPAKLLRSEDGGATWTLIDLSDRAGMILDVKFFDPNVGFVFAATSGDLAQSNARILKTTDGGRTWRQVYRSARPNEIIWKASFPNSTVGYATVQNDDPETLQQHIVKTVDGGDH
jgi:photosystem II stability/assembly factor-like uncharacterized protein